MVLGGGALVLLLVAVQDLAAAFGDPLDGRVGFLGAVLHLERAFDGSGRRAQEIKRCFQTAARDRGKNRGERDERGRSDDGETSLPVDKRPSG